MLARCEVCGKEFHTSVGLDALAEVCAKLAKEFDADTKVVCRECFERGPDHTQTLGRYLLTRNLLGREN